MQLEFLPQATADLYQYARQCPELKPFTLVGGTALALQIGHRLSLDLHFAVFDEQLPVVAIQQWLARLADDGIAAKNITSPSAAATFRIDTGRVLTDYAQDYEVAGVMVTFFTLGRNLQQRRYYQTAGKRSAAAHSFSVLGIEGLKVAKTLLLADRIRSRDLFDLMVLIRDHGLKIEDMVNSVNMLGHNNDFEHYSAVLTGELALDRQDEGLTGPKVSETMADIYQYLGQKIDAWQVASASQAPKFLS